MHNFHLTQKNFIDITINPAPISWSSRADASTSRVSFEALRGPANCIHLARGKSFTEDFTNGNQEKSKKEETLTASGNHPASFATGLLREAPLKRLSCFPRTNGPPERHSARKFHGNPASCVKIAGPNATADCSENIWRKKFARQIATITMKTATKDLHKNWGAKKWA